MRTRNKSEAARERIRPYSDQWRRREWRENLSRADRSLHDAQPAVQLYRKERRRRVRVEAALMREAAVLWAAYVASESRRIKGGRPAKRTVST